MFAHLICLCSICSSNKLCHFAEFDASVDFVYSADQIGYVFAAHSAPRIHFLIPVIVLTVLTVLIMLLVKMNSTCMLVYIDMLLATVKDATVACSLLVIFYMFAIKRVFAAPSG